MHAGASAATGQSKEIVFHCQLNNAKHRAWFGWEMFGLVAEAWADSNRRQSAWRDTWGRGGGRGPISMQHCTLYSLFFPHFCNPEGGGVRGRGGINWNTLELIRENAGWGFNPPTQVKTKSVKYEGGGGHVSL